MPECGYLGFCFAGLLGTGRGGFLRWSVTLGGGPVFVGLGRPSWGQEPRGGRFSLLGHKPITPHRQDSEYSLSKNGSGLADKLSGSSLLMGWWEWSSSG